MMRMAHRSEESDEIWKLTSPRNEHQRLLSQSRLADGENAY